MSALTNFNERIRDRLSVDWLTPSEKVVWTLVQRFDAPPHRVINVYGGEGTGKTFLGWLMDRERYASYAIAGHNFHPVYPRLVIDDAPSDKPSTRAFRPLIEELNIKQVILLTRFRVEESDLPAFELKVDAQDLEYFGANMYRHMRMEVIEGYFRNYKSVLKQMMG